MVFPGKMAARPWHARTMHIHAMRKKTNSKLLQDAAGQSSIVECHLASCRALQVLLEASTVTLVQEVSEADLQANMHP